ncbi:methionyl-tRNA formyltransferase [Loigolactobacillus backii]|uniref:Methionyl-tRNA formyltransferase n=1 Tax=Loigolactobacillus backii TaxID=375175 RepID=A0A192H2L0_9LACO|nr:methionyl-tRNA formyltransferase [Loigolactobacillus backii]ANK59372.1 methionyl-tRNA formyltransferase [Loigolactobacillus backii]ANK63049.1 methionyl-tRNA formyltransferase [Loigolactobacillus backii]ANK64365.1 methionyl-tRNA formyltransferase [Loigolactobacillus backii]ANK67239.1 methionyl-tRNA formyltransferase [Loigolactobacillus backii]ANK69943.1 methionyl-tRNA formyltransferase [Loigolactobacillus backii]
MTSIVFMGTPEFSAPILESLLKQGYAVLAVVTQPDRPVGRKHVLTPSPVKRVALEHQLEVLQPEKLSGSPEAQRIIDLAPDLIVTAAFGQFLPKSVLAAPKIAALNVHASLLPKYRGGAPIQYSLLNGEKETGVTIMKMVMKMDAGDILRQERLPIEATDDSGSLFAKLSVVGERLLRTTLPDFLAGKITPQVQDSAKVTFAPNIKPEQEEINLENTAHQIDCQVRALRPEPGAYVMMLGKRTKLWSVAPLAEKTTQAPGSVVTVTKHQLTLAAGAGSVFAVNEIQPAGKARMPITAFLNGIGHGIKEGQQLFDGK